jgi:hypothetical protein
MTKIGNPFCDGEIVRELRGISKNKCKITLKTKNVLQIRNWYKRGNILANDMHLNKIKHHSSTN